MKIKHTKWNSLSVVLQGAVLLALGIAMFCPTGLPRAFAAQTATGGSSISPGGDPNITLRPSQTPHNPGSTIAIASGKQIATQTDTSHASGFQQPGIRDELSPPPSSGLSPGLAEPVNKQASGQPDSYASGLSPDNEPKTLQGSLTSLTVVKGRSQIIRFAQPIKQVSIAEPTLADVVPLAPDEFIINGKQRGVTSLIVWDDKGQEGLFDLYIQNDTSEVLNAIHALAPTENVQARITDDSLVLTGEVSNSVILEQIQKLAAAYGYRDKNFVDLTETPSAQVMLEVKIAEANHSVLRDFRPTLSFNRGSFSLARLGNQINGASGSRSAMAPEKVIPGYNPVTPGVLTGLTAPSAVLAQASNAVGSLMATLTPGGAFEAAFEALETQGKITVLAEPKLVCTHGRTADFLAGGETPYVGGVDQNGSPIISFKEFGIKLNFTPWISARSNRVELKVAPEVSSLDTSNCITDKSGNRICGLLKRTTSTTVQLADGERLVISGILSREEQNSFSQAPFIGNIPILGQLFKNSSMDKSDRELIVIVTPHIVKPGDYGRILGASN